MSDAWAEFDRLALVEPSRLTDAQRRLVALGWLRTEVNNGGFDQYFHNSAGDLAAAARDAALAGGSRELGALIDRALAVLALGDPADRAARQERLDELSDDAFDAVDDDFVALESAHDLDEVMRRCWE